MATVESLSLEETNKLRISLGLKPLQPAPDSSGDGSAVDTVEDEERKAVENLKALRAEQAKVAEQEALRQRLKKARDRKALNEKLKGQTLGEVDETEEKEDIKSWVKRTKKREQELAAKRAQELESQDKQFQEEYTSEHLEGLKVGHDFDEIEEGEGMILTLKDRGILDEDEGDELVSTALVEKERLKENLKNKIKQPKYDPYAEDYNPQTGEKKLLSKYDEERERKTFTLGQEQEAKASREHIAPEASSNLIAISLDYEKPTEVIQDYADFSSIKIKKPKKKKKATKTSAFAEIEDSLQDDFLQIDAMQNINMIPIPSSKRKMEETAIIDDDEELQGLLAHQRRKALKAKKRPYLEDIARHIRQNAGDEDRVGEDGGLVIDDTSEFVRGLELSQLEQEDSRHEDELGRNNEMEVDETANVEDTEMRNGTPEQPELPTTGLDDEPVLNSSVSAALAAFRRSGKSETDRKSTFTYEELQRREEILENQRLRRINQEVDVRKKRDQEKLNERFNRMSQRERELYREQENQARERREAQLRMQEFNDFKFNVEIEYKDEFGQEMSKKDAFKRLSHAFHGKSSGTMKKGKYLQKVLDATKGKTASTESDVTKAGQQLEWQKKTGSAYSRIQ